MATLFTEIATSDSFNTWRTTLNSVTTRFNGLGDKDEINIDGGNIDGTPIGNTVASTGAFTNVVVNSTLDIRGGTFQIDNDAISGDKISGGTLTVDVAEIVAAPTANNHGTNKAYVDSRVLSASDDAVAFAIALG